ncbi:Uma2 family endonuclease [Neolewinella lacunae]|uniref:Uma2 family endonuclease n=1 Tax=Neolewinella lacunae TaxID=1517758 RepID=A0A923T6X3_9BACT|nr:Uma2 family endonuclease [Neolewinella lacunae]MBC6992964.1 Uma2 family endonuclease [Neolewinella lacunae]MDN3633897.1 Uma2 family endonuclease [Neolewinella lacunae]
MMTVQALPIIALDDAELLLSLHSWTLDQYEAMIAAGFLGDEDRVELLLGKIVNKDLKGVLHSYCVQELNLYLFRHFGDRFICRQGQPIALPMHSMPEPDYVLARNVKHRFRTKRPKPADVQLIIEVADTTLSRDRGTKAKLYASFGIQEYWILNLIDYQLELHLNPTEQEGYGNVQFYSRGEVFSSPLLGELAVNSLLPRIRWEEE